MARPPKLPGQKALQGNTRRQKKAVAPAAAEKPETIFFSDPWSPPDWLSDAAKAIWAEQLPVVQQMTKLQIASLPTFALYCDALHRVRKYSRDIEDNGATYTTDRGFERARPAVALRKEAAKEAKDFASELNLTTKSWIGSMGTFAGRQLDLFMNGGQAPQPPASPGAPLPAAPAAGSADEIDRYLGSRPTAH